HRSRLVEAEIGIGDRADISDVGRNHRSGWHRALELAQHLARMHVARALGDFERPWVGLVLPAVELALPGALLARNRRQPRLPVGVTSELFTREPGDQCERRRFRIATNP